MNVTYSEKFKDYAEKRSHRELKAYHTVYKFPNGFGASVIYNPDPVTSIRSYGLEVGIISKRNDWNLDYQTHITDDVLGYVEDLDAVLQEIYDLDEGEEEFQYKARELQADIDELMKKFEELEKSREVKKDEDKPERWRANDGGNYWVIDEELGVSIYTEDETKWDDRRHEVGNYFRTREEAEFEAERLRVWRELSLWAKPFEVGENNYFISYGYNSKKFLYKNYGWTSEPGLSFASEERAVQAVQAVGEDRVRRYYLGVE